MSMKIFTAVIVALLCVSCVNRTQGLLIANVSQTQDARDVLERAVDDHSLGNFFFLDRKRLVLYSYGKAISGFEFRAIDVNAVRASDPAIFLMVTCFTARSCGRSSTGDCVRSIGLDVNLTDSQKSQFVRTMKARGYPVISIDFSYLPPQEHEIIIEYFTECEFIYMDGIDNLRRIGAI